MARKTTTRKTIGTSKSTPSSKSVPSSKSTKVVATTDVRRTPVPRPAARKATEVSHDQIARRAYELFCAGEPGCELDHWLKAERELRG